MADASAPKPTSSVKLVLLGEAAVGKSSLVLRFVNNDFQENKEPTIGAAFLTQKTHLPTRTIKFEIWDTAGQERFASLAPMYYRNAQAALVAYDVTKASSLTKARHWVAELQRQASPGIVICLVGNKLDLVDDEDTTSDAPATSSNNDGAASSAEAPEESGKTDTAATEAESGSKRKVSLSEARQFAQEEQLLFFETSAKTGQNVAEVFAAVANAIPESSLKGRTAGTQTRSAAAQGGATDASRGRVDLGKPGEANKGEGCAC
ncbi:MAG: hypothetical protein Q9162_002712 [Coniocarpon cinnabarinum]